MNKLLKIIKQKKLITMVGCNMRFHDGIKSIKKFLDNNELGQIFFSDCRKWIIYA